MKVRSVKTRIFKEGEELATFITKHIPKLKNGSVLVVTSKIVSLAEGRTAKAKEFKKLIRSESEGSLEAKYGTLTLKEGMYMWNAGIDESNAAGKLVLLPKDSFRSAADLRKKLMRHYRIKKLGVLITDSRVMPLRSGVVGLALGYAGFRGLRDYRGAKDVFGRKLQYTQTNIADTLASAAIVEMGEGKERQPLAVIEDASVEFVDKVNRREIFISYDQDMYRPLFGKLLKKRRKRT